MFSPYKRKHSRASALEYGVSNFPIFGSLDESMRYPHKARSNHRTLKAVDLSL